ncbi:MAG: EpsG family protein [Ignavibacteria bacterium]
MIKLNNQKTGLYILVLVILVSRIPFLSSGYGSEPDAWRLANVSRNISVNNEYRHMSRYPGHPVQELFCSLIWKGGPVALNGVTAILSSIAFLLFALMLKKIKVDNYLLLTYAFAFTPVIYINSINSMDYMWALSFVIASFYFVVQKKLVLSGLFMGLAIGSRITSGAMLIPICYYIYKTFENQKYKRILILFIISIVVAGITYIPVIIRFGTAFFQFEMVQYPSFLYLLKNLSVSVWGIPGVLAICLGLFFLLSGFKKNQKERSADFRNFIVMSWMVILLYLIAFILAPLKPGYLIPVVPFVLIILYFYLPAAKLRIVCYLMIASSFLLGLSYSTIKAHETGYGAFNINIAGNDITVDILKGPLFLELSKRSEGINAVNNIIRYGKQVNENSVVETGDMLPLIETTLCSNKDGYVEYCYVFNETEMNTYKQNGYKLYYLPEVNKANVLFYGFDPADYGVKPFVYY